MESKLNQMLLVANWKVLENWSAYPALSQDSSVNQEVRLGRRVFKVKEKNPLNSRFALRESYRFEFTLECVTSGEIIIQQA